MTAVPLVGGRIIGTNAEKTAFVTTNLRAGWVWIESDTQNFYYWNASAWVAIAGPSATITETNRTLTTPTLTTPIVNGIKGGDVAITNTDSPYTALATTRVIRADATSGAITINLPTAVGIAGFEYHIFRTDILGSTNAITIDASSTQTIDSNLTYILWPGEYVKIESDGANWQVIGRPTPTAQGYYFRQGSTPNCRYVAGQINCANPINVSTTSPAANVLSAFPFIVGKTTKFDLIEFRVTSVSTAGNSRAGIYRDNGLCFPGALIFDTGSISTSAAANTKSTTITAGLQVFQPGLYWLAYEQDTATGQYACLIGNFAVLNVTGHPGVISTGTTLPWHYTVAHTFGALPDPYTTSATLDNTNPTATTAKVAVSLRAI